ncbi:hypothetical protein KL918_004713 [Ogataea parapolymorpha]|uniref:Secreted protein n=1 Tax=Ogataea parapolymorpha (strain ATCC 26012 / BCRC 20466 / JCM 22074 / NRRL Y-7560 / DL-1) TaxID=871575 RepID=W1QKL8_OGAPD|nr:hypothetical protein HPODL_00154 [Ogataea parapolymorpha DL-1]ESX03662.1 hypothetical protein HPODL_00154 [Ogataea parapolymorpha DL-1]KAG7865471.1 hypothetical protein KL918_004713 [Ogataea parapolymorpha]KAG7873916.1 hypothetical protein KL916_002076 [Ogataea parapolymorpha]
MVSILGIVFASFISYAIAYCSASTSFNIGGIEYNYDSIREVSPGFFESIPDADTSRRLANLSQEEKREYARQKRAILFNESSADLPASMQSPTPV